MSDELKSLDHYLSNPDELAKLTDDQLDKLSQTTPEQPAPETAKAEEKASETPEKQEEPKAEAKTETGEAPKEEAQPEGILSKDGKHVIPYWRLAEAEARAREAADRAAQLEQQLTEQPKSGKTPDKASETAAPDYAAIDAQLEDFPELQAAFRASHARIEQLNGALTTLNARFQQLESNQTARAKNEQELVQQDVDSAIAATPKLAYLQRAGEDGKMADPDAWDRAVNIDVMLRGQPEWKGASFADRFAKVVDVYEAMYGPIPLQTPQPTPSPAPGKTTPAASGDGKKPAAPVPTSMSAIPGGSAPPVDELAAVANKSGPELVSRYMNMTPEQIEAELNRL